MHPVSIFVLCIVSLCAAASLPGLDCPLLFYSVVKKKTSYFICITLCCQKRFKAHVQNLKNPNNAPQSEVHEPWSAKAGAEEFQCPAQSPDPNLLNTIGMN